MKTARIQLSDHFTYGRLLRFTLPSITMMIFTSIYSVVDGYFQSVEKPGLRIRIDRVSRQTEGRPNGRPFQRFFRLALKNMAKS